ncbi:uncharacterized protein EMH_0029830 [Eimeria mitis]|uniref:Uncharacterized protein n=1 Tax=Eimeria mitis TaxID=44415 RepID=U6JUM3_9EIME|nr:uncharacterized protein EMH_0029830 [Eimeria mitis]CDJ27223.1 hypothetical protein, conserved [Eimeria mitis]
MKFSASLRLEALPHLIGITAALQRLARGGPPGSCCLKLTPKKLSLNTRQPSCELYAELDMAEVFSVGWILESKRSNCVALQIEPRQLLGTLKLAQSCRRITVKLAKRMGQGALVFEFTDLQLANVWITQSNLELPRVKSLLAMLERLRKLGSEEVTLEGSINPQDCNAFDLAVSAASDLVTAKAMYTRCSRLVPEGQEALEDVSFVRSVLTKHLIAGLKACLGFRALLDCSNSQGAPINRAGLSNLELPRVKSLLAMLERLRKLGSEEVTLEGSINPQDCNAFDLAVSAASDLVTAKAMYTRCSRLVPEGQEALEDVSFVRSVLTKHLIAGLKACLGFRALLDCSNSQGKEIEGLVALLVPEDEAVHGWLSVVLQNEGGPPRLSGAPKALRGPQGSQGPPGPSGALKALGGPQGAQGPPSLSGDPEDLRGPQGFWGPPRISGASGGPHGIPFCLVPEDEAVHGWLSVVLQNEGLESVRVLLVLPTVPQRGPIE